MHKKDKKKLEEKRILPCHLALQGWVIFQNGVTLDCICQVRLLEKKTTATLTSSAMQSSVQHDHEGRN